MKAAQKNTYQTGLFAESVAALFLSAKGFKIIKQRYKTGVGEIDLVALDGETLVFIEVKGRPSEDEALFSITPRMKSRITNAAGHFLAANPEHAGRSMRFDVVAVCPPFSIRHLDNAWQTVS